MTDQPEPALALQPASTAPLAAGLPLVQGRCPACGHASLFLGNGGHVTCSIIDCPNPSLADEQLHGEQPVKAATEATQPAKSPLREQIAAAIYEKCNPGYRWADAHPDDELAYGSDADAALTVVLPHGKFIGDQLRDSETRRAEERTVLAEVLGHFVHKGHPGEPCLSSGWISERTVARWRAVLYPPTPAPGSGPTVAEAAQADRNWDVQKGGE